MNEDIEADTRTAGPEAAPDEPTPVTVVPVERPRLWQRWQRFRPRQVLPALASLILVVALLLGAWLLSLRGQVAGLERQAALMESDLNALQGELLALEEENRALASQLSTSASELAVLEEANEELRRQLQSQEQILAILTSPESRTVAIDDTGAQPDARGMLTIDDAIQTAVLTVANLEPLEQGRVYQLWLIQDGEPVSAGVFDVGEDGRETLLIPYGQVGTFDAIGVSIEPEGGSEQPTGDFVLLEEVSF